MAVQQNECYRLVTIGYLKKLIEQSGSGSSLKSLIQKSDGTYQGVGGTRDDYCPTYGELSAGTYVQVYKAGTTPNGDTDGLVINQRWTGDTAKTYTETQCVDRADVSVRYTRISGLQLSVGKHTFDGCGESGTSVSVSNTYNRKTKSMNGCAAAEGSIVYSTTTTEASATCDGTFTFHKSLANTVSTINCTKYDITKNTGSTQRTDDVYVTVKFRGTNYDSNHEILTQPAGDGAYSKVVSTTNIPTDITVTPSHTNYKVPATCDDKCVASANTTVSLTPKGVYDVVTTYSYVQCGVDIPSKGTISAVTKTNQTINLPAMSSAFTASGSCSDEIAPAGTEINIASKNVTVNWSGLTLTKTFLMTATTRHCESEPPISECCQLNGPMTLSCSGTAQFEIGECGCDNMVDLGLSVKWGEYPIGTNENYEGVSFSDSYTPPTGFVFFQWGWVDKWTTGGTSHVAYTGDIKTTTPSDSDSDIDDNLPAGETKDAAKYHWPDSGYRMPTKKEAQELINNTSKEWKTDYKGISGLNGYLLTSTKVGYTDKSIFLPAVGEFYPENETAGNPWFFRSAGTHILIWTRTGYKEADNNYSAYRFVYPDGSDPLKVTDSSRRYGNIIMPVCDRG